MTEDEVESFRLWGDLLLLAKQHPGGSAAWAVDEIKRLQEAVAVERERLIEDNRMRAALEACAADWISARRARGRRRERMAFAVLAIMLLCTLILLLAACQVPLRTNGVVIDRLIDQAKRGKETIMYTPSGHV